MTTLAVALFTFVRSEDEWTTCSTDADCGYDGWSCQYGTCVESGGTGNYGQCVTNEQCMENQVCHYYECIDQCVDDEQCTGNQVCSQYGECLQGGGSCFYNSDCAEFGLGYFCIQGACGTLVNGNRRRAQYVGMPAPPSTNCQTSWDCAGYGEFCYLGSSGNPNFCAYSGAQGSLCEDASGCGDGFNCQYGVCMSSGGSSNYCSYDSDCEWSGYTCEDGVCTYTGSNNPGNYCSYDTDCWVGQTCQNGVCETDYCSYNSDCGYNEHCEYGACVLNGNLGQCVTNEQCTGNQVCSHYGECVQGGLMGGRRLAVTKAQALAASGQPIESNKTPIESKKSDNIKDEANKSDNLKAGKKSEGSRRRADGPPYPECPHSPPSVGPCSTVGQSCSYPMKQCAGGVEFFSCTSSGNWAVIC